MQLDHWVCQAKQNNRNALHMRRSTAQRSTAQRPPAALRLCANVLPQRSQLVLLPLGVSLSICRRAAAARQLGHSLQQGCRGGGRWGQEGAGGGRW